MRIVSIQHQVYGIALGDIVSFSRWFAGHDRWVVRRIYGATIIRPIALVPGIRFRWVRLFTYCGYACLLRLYLALVYPGNRKRLWFFEPFHMPILLTVFSGYTKIYDCVDYFPGFNAQTKREHDIVMARASYVFANSGSLAKKLKQTRSDVFRVPLGIAEELFHKRPSPIRPKKKTFIVGYIGSISDRIDFPLLRIIVQRLPDVRFEFVGPMEPNVFDTRGQAMNEMKQILHFSNVHWERWVSKNEIPEFLARVDVGLIPYRVDTDFNRYCFPMKTLEYFAMGRPIVTTNIAALAVYSQKGLVRIAQNANEFIRAIQFYRTNGWKQKQQQTQRLEAARHSWKNKVNMIISVLNSAGPGQ